MSWGSTSWGSKPRPVVRLVRLLLGPCLLSLAAVACSTVSVPPEPAPTRPTTTTATQSGPAAEVVSLTNARRAAAGCGPLASQAQLTRAAQLHANDMAANNYFAHNSQDGRAPWDRARQQGFTGRGIGENIAKGYPTASAVMDGWMNSPGHRANIENCAYRHIGVGYHAATKTWVQLFGT
jgi:uncharacterized protein YkwD